MGVDYRRTGSEKGPRTDIAAAIGKLPAHVVEQLTRTCGQSVELLTAHLPAGEFVDAIASATPGYPAKEFHCLLALTSRRLLFVAPSPQVISWRLPAITKVQALSGTAGLISTFFVDDSAGGSYQLGIDGQWGEQFVPLVKDAIARAILRDE